jgi:hypothetical protein
MSRSNKSKAVTDPINCDETSLADIARLLKAQSEQMAVLTTQIGKIDKIESEVRDLKTLIVSLKDENKDLRAQVKEKDKVIDDMSQSISSLEEKMNMVEQHHRSWGARILNIKVSDEEAADPTLMIEKVFNLALRPMLEAAVNAGRLPAVPPAHQVLEIAHVLPGKPGLPRPIIMRFFSRNVRSLCFQFKRDFAPRDPAVGEGNQEGSTRKGRFTYPLYDDLTKPTLMKMRAINQDERVHACWTVNGKIHFRLKNSDTVRKVVSIQDPLDVILK